MQITFFIPKTTTWNRAQAMALAFAQAHAGYSVRVIESEYRTDVAQDGISFVHPPVFAKYGFVRALWCMWHFAIRRRGIVHVAGVQSGFTVALIRTLHPGSRVIVHIDDIAETQAEGFFAYLSRRLALRFAHARVTSHKAIKRHEALHGMEVQYLPFLAYSKGQLIDTSVLRAHGVELQQFFLGVVNPSSWSDLQNLVKTWRESVRALDPQLKLAIVFSEDMPSEHIAFGHDVVILGHVTPYVESMLLAGARAVVVPHLAAYRLPIVEAMSTGKYAVPLHELVNRNPFALEELAELYRSAQHEVADLCDAAMTMSWGHIARNVIAEEHDPSHIATQYESLYEHLLFAGATTVNARMS